MQEITVQIVPDKFGIVLSKPVLFMLADRFII